jgi:fructose-1,6-bisphosphatase II
VAGNDLIMSATGVTDGTMLRGVRFDDAGGAVTESLVIRSQSGPIRRLVSEHAAAKVAYLAPPSTP